MKLLPDFKSWTQHKWHSECLGLIAACISVNIIMLNNLSWWYLLAFVCIDVLASWAGYYRRKHEEVIEQKNSTSDDSALK